MFYCFNTGMDTEFVKEFMASGMLWVQLIDFSILQVVIIWNRDEFLIFFYEVYSLLLDLGVHSLVG